MEKHCTALTQIGAGERGNGKNKDERQNQRKYGRENKGKLNKRKKIKVEFINTRTALAKGNERNKNAYK